MAANYKMIVALLAKLHAKADNPAFLYIQFITLKCVYVWEEGGQIEFFL